MLYVVPNGSINSSSVTIQVKEFPDIYTTGLSGRKALPTHRRLPAARKVGLFNLGSSGNAVTTLLQSAVDFAFKAEQGFRDSFCVFCIYKNMHIQSIYRERLSQPRVEFYWREQ